MSIPEGRLVPTLPLRLNYLLWLEDLLTLAARRRGGGDGSVGGGDGGGQGAMTVVGADIGVCTCSLQGGIALVIVGMNIRLYTPLQLVLT